MSAGEWAFRNYGQQGGGGQHGTDVGARNAELGGQQAFERR
jgi:hypothetical protein